VTELDKHLLIVGGTLLLLAVVLSGCIQETGSEGGAPPPTEGGVYKGTFFMMMNSTASLFQSSTANEPPVYNPARMKDGGQNAVTLVYIFSKSENSSSYDFQFPRELVVAFIQEAHKYGIKVVLSTSFEPVGATLVGDIGSYPKPWEIDVEAANSKIIEAAELAEEYGVEFFAPLNEPDCVFWENSTEWGQEILPRVREVYHGEIIWRGAIFPFIEKMLSGEFPTNFSGYDYIGVGLTPRYDMTLEEYPQFVDDVLNTVLTLAERDNCKGVMVSEFGTWGWETHQPSEEDIVRACEIVLERAKNKVVGFFMGDTGAVNRPKLGEMLRSWYRDRL